MENTREKIEHNVKLRQHLTLIHKIAKVEYKALVAQHLIEYDEIVNIGIQTVDILFSSGDSELYNESYLKTAIKWAIRNELRRRYRWHGVKINSCELEPDKNELREAIYKTILSTDEMFDADKPFEIKDQRNNPEEDCEFNQLAAHLRKAVQELPKKERELIEARFFKDKKLVEIAEEFSISPSRISRIIKTGLDRVRIYLIQNDLS